MPSLVQELADTGNRIDSWTKSGFGLPTVKKQWDQDVKDYSKYTMAGPVAATVGRIIKGTVVGFFTGLRDIAQGDASLEDFLHVASMMAIPVTMGGSAAAAGANAAKAGMTMANAHRAGRVWGNLTKLNKQIKNITRDTPGTWGGLNFRKWNEMGSVTKASQIAETLEYPTNPEELWYEIIGDVGIQGALKTFGGGTGWITEQLATPERQMHAQERGIEKRLKKVAKIDASMAQAFRTLYDGVGERIGTEVSEGRIRELDALIEQINNWESETKFDWLTRTHTNESEEDVFVQQFLEGAETIETEINARNAESARATADTEEPVQTTDAPAQPAGPVPETVETPQEAEPPTETPTPPPPAAEAAEQATSSEAAEQQEAEKIARAFQTTDAQQLSLAQLELGEMEGVDPTSIAQSDENANRTVREAIQDKAQQVYQQGDRYLEALAESNEARQAAAAEPENTQLQLLANEAEDAADQAFENWLNAISPSIGKEPEGETSTNEMYIADEKARAERYADVGRGFLQVATDPAVMERQETQAGEDMNPEVVAERHRMKQGIAMAATSALEQHAQNTTETAPAPAPEAAPTPEEIVTPTQPETDTGFSVSDPQTTERIKQLRGAPAPPQAAQGSIRQRVIEAIAKLPAAATATDIAKLASSEGDILTAAQIQTALRWAKKQGAIEVVREGRQARYQLAAQPEPEAEVAPEPPAAATTGEAYLNNLFDADDNANPNDDDAEVTFGSPTAEPGRNVVDAIVDSLATGATSVADVESQLNKYQEQATALQAKEVLTTEEAGALNRALTRVQHLQDALTLWGNQVKFPDVPDIIDDVLYFKLAESSGPFKSLSNFFPAQMSVGGKSYKTVEHYFQSEKFADTGLKTTIRDRYGNTKSVLVSEAIQMASKPGDAWALADKNFGRLTEEQISAWNGRRDAVMYEALFAKFQSPVQYDFNGESKTLAEWLVGTGDMPLVHIEHVSTARRAVTNAPSYWGAHFSPAATITRVDEAGDAYEAPALFTGNNRLGEMLMELRASLIEGTVKTRPGTTDPKMMAVADLPDYVQRGLEALNLNVQHIHTFRKVRQIVEKIKNGAMVTGVSGGRRDFSSVTGYADPDGNWVDFDTEELLARKVDLAMRKGWITNESQWNAEVEERVDVYNDTQKKAADAAFAFSIGLRSYNSVVATGGAFGTDISAVRGAVGAYQQIYGGSALVMMPEGIQKRQSPHSNRVQYNPNVPELDYAAKNLGAISLYPENYDANQAVSGEGGPTFTKHLFDRNGVVAAFSHVLFITHANEASGGTVDTAHKALQLGKPVVILDPNLFDSPLEGSEYLATLPGVFVLKESPNFPLYGEQDVQDRETGEMRREYRWNARNLALAARFIATATDPTLPHRASQDYLRHTQDWSESQIKDRIRELHEAAAVATAPFERLRIEVEVKDLNRIRAERHPSPSRQSPVDFEYVTQLDPTERKVKGGLIGLHNYNSFEELYAALKASNTKVFVDVRQSAYSSDWTDGNALRNAFLQTDIDYVVAPQFTPTGNNRQYQMIIDSLTSIPKNFRGGLEAKFTAAYHNFLKETRADMGMFLKDTIAMHIGYQNTEGSTVAFGCIERGSPACHRSILGEIMRDVLGVGVVDIHEGGLTTEFEPHDHSHDEMDLPIAPYTSRSLATITPAVQAYVPSRTSLMQLVNYTTNENGLVMSVNYRHPDYPGYELVLRRKPDNTITFVVVFPPTQESNLIQKEGRIETELGAAKQVTPFPSESEVVSRYKTLDFDTDNFPAIAEHLFRSFAPSINNPELYVDTESIESAPDHPLIPRYEGGRLKHRVVRSTEPSEALVYGRDRWRVGERVVMGEAHQTADENQRYTIQDQGIPYGERVAPTEHESHHYYWRETPDVEVRLSPSGKYLSAVIPHGYEVDVPTGFPLNVHYQQSWQEWIGTEAFLRGETSRSVEDVPVRIEADNLYEFLFINPHIWASIDAEGRPLHAPAALGLMADSVNNLPDSIRRAVYGNVVPEQAEADWALVKAFMQRGQQIQQEGGDYDTAEVDAARRFASRLPQPPNILTQVRRYLTAVHKAIKRSDPVADTLVSLPHYNDYEPHVLNATLLSDVTNEGVGADSTVDVEVEGGEQVLAGQMEQEELEDVEPEDSTDEEMAEAVATADAETEEEVSDTEREIMELAQSAGAAGIPFPSEVAAAYELEWFERHQTVAVDPNNAADRLWQDGTLRVRRDITEFNPQTQRWVSTGEQQAAGLETMVSTLRRSLRNTIRNRNISKEARVRMNGIRDRLSLFTRDADFNQLDIWSENSATLSALLNTFRDAYNVMAENGGLGNFQLKGHLLTSLPVGQLSARHTVLYTDPGTPRRMDMILTNSGQLVPVDTLSKYVVDPTLKQLFQRPATQLQMIVDSMQETDETGETRTLTRFFVDNNKDGQSYEVTHESDTMLEASVVGTHYTVRVDKTSGEVVMAYPRSGWQSDPIFITDWQNTPLSTTNETRRALAPIAMAVKHGFFPNTHGMPLKLYHIGMANEGRWDYRLNGDVAFDLGAGGVVRSTDYQFVVSVVPNLNGFVYQVEAYQGMGDDAVNANVFRNPDETPTNTVLVFMQKGGVTRAPHEAILEAMWYQREAAMEHGWRLPQDSKLRPVTREIDYEHPPATSFDGPSANPNDIYFESWERWADEIQAQFGTDVVRAAEQAVFEAEYPIHSRGQAWIELMEVAANHAERGSPEHTQLTNLLQMGLPGLLREHLIAQNAFTPTDAKFAEIESRSPVIRKYQHKDFEGYTIEMREGSGRATIKDRHVVLSEVDYENTDNMWEAVGTAFHEIVHASASQRLDNKDYDFQTLENGDAVWIHANGDSRIRFDAALPTVILEERSAQHWIPLEETRHQLKQPLASAPVHEQAAYIERIEKQFTGTVKNPESTEDRAADRAMDTPAASPETPEATAPTTEAMYHGPVRELPPDVDDYNKYLGEDAPAEPQIRRFARGDNAIEVHLLMPDQFYSPPMREEGESRYEYRRAVFSMQARASMSDGTV